MREKHRTLRGDYMQVKMSVCRGRPRNENMVVMCGVANHVWGMACSLAKVPCVVLRRSRAAGWGYLRRVLITLQEKKFFDWEGILLESISLYWAKSASFSVFPLGSDCMCSTEWVFATAFICIQRWYFVSLNLPQAVNTFLIVFTLLRVYPFYSFCLIVYFHNTTQW